MNLRVGDFGLRKNFEPRDLGCTKLGVSLLLEDGVAFDRMTN